jgi:hypothetical protein
MSVLVSNSTQKSSRFAYSCALGPLLSGTSAWVDLFVPLPSTSTYSFVELKFATSTGYDPWPIPVIVGLVTIPSKADGTLAYHPSFQFSVAGDLHQLYSPPEDLLLFTWVTDSSGTITSSHPFTLSPFAHLVVVAATLQTPDENHLYVTGIVSGNVAFA